MCGVRVKGRRVSAHARSTRVVDSHGCISSPGGLRVGGVSLWWWKESRSATGIGEYIGGLSKIGLQMVQAQSDAMATVNQFLGRFLPQACPRGRIQTGSAVAFKLEIHEG